MHKVSTPGDRAYVARSLPVVMTKLEMAMPLSWNTTVVHLFTFHTVELLEAAGPFVEQNMLDIERYHTLFKGLARGTTNIMCSIKNHYEIYEACQQNRLTEDVDWTAPARNSTAAGLAAKPDSALKDERCIRTVGEGKTDVLPDDDMRMLQDLWAVHYPGYAAMVRTYRMQAANRARGGRDALPISEWEPRYRPLSDDEKNWRDMSPNITVRFDLGGMV
jgi:hypothetical protein